MVAWLCYVMLRRSELPSRGPAANIFGTQNNDVDLPALSLMPERSGISLQLRTEME